MSAKGVINPSFVSAEHGDSRCGGVIEHEAEPICMEEIDNHESEDETVGYGDADKHGCWPRFVRFGRKIWATRETENANEDRELYIKTTLRELLIYILFVITLVTVAFGILDVNAYYMTQTIKNALMESTSDGEDMSLAKVNSIDDFWKVLEGPVLDNLYHDKWYNDRIQNKEEVYYISYDSLLVGVPRLRQVRMPSNSCSIPEDFSSQITSCYGAYWVTNEDKTSYGPGNSTAWTYTSPDVLKAGYHWGNVAVYGGGGYYVDLPRNFTEARAVIGDLYENLWIDRSSRAIFLHITTYNPNVNLFCTVSLVIEIPATGGVITTGEFRTVKLLRYVHTQDYVILVFEFLFILFIIYYIAEEIIEISKLGCAYFRKFWNILDIIVIILSCICVSFNIYRTLSVRQSLTDLLSSPEQYSNFEVLSFWEMQFNYAIGGLVFIVWIKIFKYVSFNKTMNQLNLTLGNCAKDIAGFGVMFCIVFFAFAQLGYLAFGTQVSDFGTFSTSLLTLFRIILGDFDFQALRDAQSIFGPLYFLVYIFFVFFVLINMFIAIINDTYLEVKSNQLKQPSEFQMKSFFKKRLKDMRHKLKQKKTQLEELQHAINAVDVDEKDMTMNEFKADMAEVPDGYTLEELFHNADADKNMKLSVKERRALKETLENKKMRLVEEMVQYQEAELGQSFEQVSKLFSATVASKDEVNRAFIRLTRLENCIKSVTERLKNMVNKLDLVKESKSKRTDQMNSLLENIVSTAVTANEDEPFGDKLLAEKPDEKGSVSADGVRKRPESGISSKFRAFMK